MSTEGEVRGQIEEVKTDQFHCERIYLLQSDLSPLQSLEQLYGEKRRYFFVSTEWISRVRGLHQHLVAVVVKSRICMKSNPKEVAFFQPSESGRQLFMVV